MVREVNCIKLKIKAEGLEYLPYPGELGQKIYDNISKQAWQSWLGQQTILINEYRLNLTEKESRDFLKQEMVNFLFSEEN